MTFVTVNTSRMCIQGVSEERQGRGVLCRELGVAASCSGPMLEGRQMSLGPFSFCLGSAISSPSPCIPDRSPVAAHTPDIHPGPTPQGQLC